MAKVRLGNKVKGAVMSNGQLRVPVVLTEGEFVKKTPEEQMKLLYDCLIDIQYKLTWNWRKMFIVGLVAGFLGGAFDERVIPWLLKLCPP